MPFITNCINKSIQHYIHANYLNIDMFFNKVSEFSFTCINRPIMEFTILFLAHGQWIIMHTLSSFSNIGCILLLNQIMTFLSCSFPLPVGKNHAFPILFLFKNNLRKPIRYCQYFRNFSSDFPYLHNFSFNFHLHRC